MTTKKSTSLDRFIEWLEKELQQKGKISLDEILLSGAEKMDITIDTAKRYLGKALMIRTGQIKLNLDENKGMKFLEYRKDFHYTGDRSEHEDYQGTENHEWKGVSTGKEDSGRNVYDMKDEGEDSKEDKDSKEDVEEEE